MFLVVDRTFQELILVLGKDVHFILVTDKAINRLISNKKIK